MAASSINDIEMGYFGSEIVYSATTGVGPCVGFLVLFDNSKHIYIEHHSPVCLPSEINLATVQLWLQNVAKRVSATLPESKITSILKEDYTHVTIILSAYEYDMYTVALSENDERETQAIFDLYNKASDGKTNNDQTLVFWISD
ncbi:unnamed protein product [Rotaria sp. Silwood1]|nr:unnamed protein product [Rotaria sp. Silwood1]CAF3932835.1 unnamed protein product [Rotaria sp. Silwood1]CAF3940962.1 unnamed protein product [Rotaria sp. Silwood1]CAF3987939.1 unnamed protein product [Rotaria sp. Silwood1]CAF4851573.1 unnamed protein product [Rotaria sp. Silwood1]